jgi:hypothetical protein
MNKLKTLYYGFRFWLAKRRIASELRFQHPDWNEAKVQERLNLFLEE